MATDDEGHRLGVLERGVLDDITKPPSSRSRTGSRVTSSNPSNTSASSTSSRLRPQVAAALELLTPEEVMEQEEFDLELEDYGGSSDETTEEELDGVTGRTSEIFRIAEPLKEPPEVYMSEDTTLTEDDDKQLAIYGSLMGDEETLVDSDEENLIMKEIRAEITAKVRSEMKSELEMYKKKREALTSAAGGEKEKEDEPDEQDPKLREAIIKMRKLDRILSKKVQREKEVKRDRIMLQRRLRDELSNIKPESGGREPKEVQTNTAKFLALTLPPSHNIGVLENPCREGVKLEEDPSDPTPQPPVTPLFATQYVDEGSMSNRDSNRSGKSREGNDAKSEGASTSRSKLSQAGTASQSGVTDDSQSMYSGATSSTNLTGKSRGKRKKNFLKRNKELASDAANLIAMTEDEKRRVDNLLINLEALPEVPEAVADGASTYGDTSYNPFQVVLANGEGFLPESGDMDRLRDIDSRLQAIMPAKEFESITSTPRSVQSHQNVLFTRTALDEEVDSNQLGEIALKETKEERDFQKRLREIEDELNTLTSAVEHEMESPRLSENQLQGLLDQCALTMQRATTETDALAQSQQEDFLRKYNKLEQCISDISHSRAALLANPPRLEEETLQQLLDEARSEIHLSSSRLTVNSMVDQPQGETEPLTEQNIKELLQDSRATSRNISRNGAVSEDQHNSSLHKKQNWPSPNHEGRRGSPGSGGHTQFTRPHVNGYAQYPSGSSTRLGADNLHLASLDEDEMQAVMISNGMEDMDGAERRPFLPDIDPKGSLTTQRHNNNLYNVSSGDGSGRGDSGSRRSSGMGNSYNSVSDHVGFSSRDDDSTPTPHPPNSGRPSSGSTGRHRSIVAHTPMD